MYFLDPIVRKSEHWVEEESDASNEINATQSNVANQSAGKVKKQQEKKDQKICHLKLCQVHKAILCTVDLNILDGNIT